MGAGSGAHIHDLKGVGNRGVAVQQVQSLCCYRAALVQQLLLEGPGNVGQTCAAPDTRARRWAVQDQPSTPLMVCEATSPCQQHSCMLPVWHTLYYYYFI